MKDRNIRIGRDEGALNRGWFICDLWRNEYLFHDGEFRSGVGKATDENPAFWPTEAEAIGFLEGWQHMKDIAESIRRHKMMKIDVQLSDLYKDNPPRYATPGSAGLDLRAETEIADCLVIPPHEVRMVSTGVSMWLRDPGYAVMALPKSGLGTKHGIILGNCVGLIDSDYQGEIKLSIWNRTRKPFTINRGDEIAQLVIVPVVQAQFNVVDEFESNTERGSGGFGSTGK